MAANATERSPPHAHHTRQLVPNKAAKRDPKIDMTHDNHKGELLYARFMRL